VLNLEESSWLVSSIVFASVNVLTVYIVILYLLRCVRIFSGGLIFFPALRYQPPFGTVCARIALGFVVFMKNPINYTFFGSLIIPGNDFIFKKEAEV